MGKILVVDDSNLILKFAKSELEKEGHEVFTATNGEECIDKALEAMPDYIFLDVVMPGMDGWETLRELKKNGSLKDIPVSMLTSEVPTIETFKKEEITGLVHYILKPVKREVLLDAIANTL